VARELDTRICAWCLKRVPAADVAPHKKNKWGTVLCRECWEKAYSDCEFGLHPLPAPQPGK